MERKKRNWTQAELSKRAGIDQALLSRLETGVMKAYPLWKRKLGDALAVNPDILFQEVKTYESTSDSH
ncbi:MAG: helix-turn-helix domain-containing protein [Candidatus Xenobiia bacterium LiM19]